jgi:hypothetical protein
MGRLGAVSITLVTAVSAALALSACGGSSDLLPGKTADQINHNLDQVRALVAEGDCAGAEDAVNEVGEEVDGLGGVDSKLKAALREGTDRLGEVVSSCEEEALQAGEEEAAEAEEKAEQEEQAAVEAEEDELESEEEKETKQEKKQEAAEKKEEKETEEPQEETESFEPPGQSEGVEHGKGPPAETPGGKESSAGGVGPGTEVE